MIAGLSSVTVATRRNVDGELTRMDGSEDASPPTTNVAFLLLPVVIAALERGSHSAVCCVHVYAVCRVLLSC